jgi:hypothetical protein
VNPGPNTPTFHRSVAVWPGPYFLGVIAALYRLPRSVQVVASEKLGSHSLSGV